MTGGPASLQRTAAGRALPGLGKGPGRGHGANGPVRGRSPALVAAAAGAWMAVLDNAPLWRELWRQGLLHGLQGAGIALALALAIAALLTLLVALLGWRWTLKPVLTLLLLAAAVATHFMLAYGTLIDTPMVGNVLHTNRREVADLLTPGFALSFAGLGLLPVLWLWRLPLRYGRWPQRLARNAALALAALAVALGALLAAYQPLAATLRNHKPLRYLINPLNTLYALGDLAAVPWKRNTRRLDPLGRDAQPGPRHAAGARPPLLLLALGETARAANFAFNGYARDTNPELSRLPVLSFRQVQSCGTSTAASVPCMFSHFGRAGFDARRADAENLLDVVQHAGLAVLWLDNQAGCKGVCDRVPNIDLATQPNPRLCHDGECWDEQLLDGLDARLAALPAERRARGVLLVLHTVGSHGPAYFKRSPPAFKHFQPECGTATLQDCSREQVVAAYDNTLLYTDHVLAGAIAWLAAQQTEYDTALLYLSDHGESLGEGNLYLHGLPYALAPDVQTHVPWLAWFSPGYAQWRGLDTACLRRRLDLPLSHDNLFDTVLGTLDVATAAYRPALDAYAPCVH